MLLLNGWGLRLFVILCGMVLCQIVYNQYSDAFRGTHLVDVRVAETFTLLRFGEGGEGEAHGGVGTEASVDIGDISNNEFVQDLVLIRHSISQMNEYLSLHHWADPDFVDPLHIGLDSCMLFHQFGTIRFLLSSSSSSSSTSSPSSTSSSSSTSSFLHPVFHSFLFLLHSISSSSLFLSLLCFCCHFSSQSHIL